MTAYHSPETIRVAPANDGKGANLAVPGSGKPARTPGHSLTLPPVGYDP
jgi:hypothetical protein